MRLVAAIGVLFGLVFPAFAQDAGLKSLQTGNDSRGWEAVGRLNLGDRGFCTGSLIADDLVLTAAHCLFDKETGASIDPTTIEFLAGWRNGRAAAYRSVTKAVAHPEYVYGGHENIDRVPYDIAVLRLDQPIRLPSILPFETNDQPKQGDQVEVVSYAQDRSEVPSLQQLCHVLENRNGIVIFSCDVDFGSSGAPVFSMRDGRLQIVSVVSAKAELAGRKVALGMPLTGPLDLLLKKMAEGGSKLSPKNVRVLSGGSGGKFIKP
ncbi:trypsin-like serine peptidase [Thioclava sp. FR2]|uniref:trypsin-like serine peptidase n=1 Tax=Thioclava sp. FR2 TaxID=3445780 RepID=UPI003EBCC6EE